MPVAGVSNHWDFIVIGLGAQGGTPVIVDDLGIDAGMLRDAGTL